MKGCIAYDLANSTYLAGGWTRLYPADLRAAESYPALADYCVSIPIKKGTSLPSWVPIIGGKYEFEVRGKGYVSPGVRAVAIR